MAQFMYDALHEQHIRLFKLDLNGAEGAVTGKLVTFRHPRHYEPTWKNATGWIRHWHDLRFTEKEGDDYGYDALSYAWGELKLDNTHSLVLSATGKVYINGVLHSDGRISHQGSVQISDSLHTLLRQLRLMKYDRFLWIDSICIDQQNDVEKSSQIALMGDIYKEAKQLLVWLGKASAIEEGALAIMPAIIKKIETSKTNQILSEINHPTSAESLGLPPLSHPIWPAIGKLMTRSWFTRLWTLQEAVLPPKIRVLCGSREVDWETLVQFCDMLNRVLGRHFLNWTMTGDTDIEPRQLSGYDAIWTVEHCRTALQRYIYGVPLNFLLNATRRREASNPVDMIFGMLGMASRGLVKNLAIDISLPQSEVFLAFARHYIRNEVYECILNHTDTQEKLIGLPSWCPNFSSPAATCSIGSRWFWGRDLSPVAVLQGFCAGFTLSGDWAIPTVDMFEMVKALPGKILHQRNLAEGVNDTTNPRQISLTPNLDQIRASGMVVDIVKQVVPCRVAPKEESKKSCIDARNLFEWESQCLELAKKTLSGTEEFPEVYWRSLIANQTITEIGGDLLIWDKYGKTNLLPQYHAWKTHLQQLAQHQTKENLLSKNLDRPTRRFAGTVSRITHRRSFFATRDGRIGIGPAETRIGDDVCVFFYCPTPYLLREGEAAQQFVGEVYVHDLMYGKALDMLVEGRVKEKQFIIG